LVGCNDGNLYALNATNGHFLWSYQTGNYVDWSPAIVDGVVYFGSDSGSFLPSEQLSIPEFPVWTLFPLSMAAIAIATVAYKTNLCKNEKAV